LGTAVVNFSILWIVKGVWSFVASSSECPCPAASPPFRSSTDIFSPSAFQVDRISFVIPETRHSLSSVKISSDPTKFECLFLPFHFFVVRSLYDVCICSSPGLVHSSDLSLMITDGRRSCLSDVCPAVRNPKAASFSFRIFASLAGGRRYFDHRAPSPF